MNFFIAKENDKNKKGIRRKIIMKTQIVNSKKAVMIGCGFVGSASVFALMQSGLFTEIALIDADKDKAEGEAMDISHGIPFASPMRIYAGDYDDVADAAIVIISAGAGQKPGETRIDLVNKNVAIFKSIIPEIAKRNFSGILLIVANPVDILTQVAIKLSGLPENRVIGSGTVLDSARLRYKLGEHLSVDSRSVHAFIIGEHGDSEVVAWSRWKKEARTASHTLLRLPARTCSLTSSLLSSVNSITTSTALRVYTTQVREICSVSVSAMQHLMQASVLNISVRFFTLRLRTSLML